MKQNNIIGIRTKSVKNPFAHNANLCGVPTDTNPLMLKALYLSSSGSPWPPVLRSILELQLQHGLRISEVLRLRVVDLLSFSKVRIKTSKRGYNRIVSHHDGSGYLAKCKKFSIIPFADYNRFYIYREYRREGLMLFHSKDKKYSVTHLFRHLLLSQLNKEINEKELISKFIGHKKMESLKSYIPK